MIKKMLIFFVSVSLVVILTDTNWVNAQQQPPRDYSDEGEEQELTRDYSDDEEPVAEEVAEEEAEEEAERGYPEHVQQQPPRDYPDDNGDDDSNGNENTKP